MDATVEDYKRWLWEAEEKMRENYSYAIILEDHIRVLADAASQFEQQAIDLETKIATLKQQQQKYCEHCKSPLK